MSNSNPSSACPFKVGDLVQVRADKVRVQRHVEHLAGHIGVVIRMRMDHDADWSLVWVSGAGQPLFEDELRSLEHHVDALVEAVSQDLELHGRSRCCLCGETVIDLRDAS